MPEFRLRPLGLVCSLLLLTQGAACGSGGGAAEPAPQASAGSAGSGGGSSKAGGSQGGAGQAGAGKAGAGGGATGGAGGSGGGGQAGTGGDAGQSGGPQAGQAGGGQGGQSGAGQAGAAQGGAGQAGAVQGGAGQGGTAQGGAGQAGTAQGGAGQAGAGQAGAGGSGGGTCGTATGGTGGSLDPTGAGVGVGTNLGPWVIDAAAPNRSTIADVAYASDGTAFVFGAFSGTTTVGSTALGPADAGDLFLARVDLSTGTPLWVKSFADSGGAEQVIAYRVRVDASDNVYVLADGFGGTSIDFGGGALGVSDQYGVLLAKFDGAGAHQWSKSLGAASLDTGRAIAVHPAGGVTVAFGAAFKVNDLGQGPLNYYVVARYDDAGTLLWSRGDGPKGGSTKLSLAGVGVDAAGNLVVAGGFHDNLDDGCGGYLAMPEPKGVWAKRYDASGNVLWARAWKASGGEAFATDVAVDAVGNAYVVGANTHQIDLGGGPLAGAGTAGSSFVGKIDAAGGHVWSHSFAGTPNAGRRVVVDASGNAVVLGDCSGASSLDGGIGASISCNLDDVFVTKWSPTGGVVWTQSFGDSLLQSSGGVAWRAGSGVLLSGQAKAQSLDLGAGTFSTDIGGIVYDKGFAIRLAD